MKTSSNTESIKSRRKIRHRKIISDSNKNTYNVCVCIYI